MRAVLCENYCDPKDLVIRDIPAPAPGEGQVAIDVEAAGLGYALRLPGVSLALDAGPAHRAACLEALALLETR